MLSFDCLTNSGVGNLYYNIQNLIMIIEFLIACWVTELKFRALYCQCLIAVLLEKPQASQEPGSYPQWLAKLTAAVNKLNRIIDSG